MWLVHYVTEFPFPRVSRDQDEPAELLSVLAETFVDIVGWISVVLHSPGFHLFSFTSPNSFTHCRKTFREHEHLKFRNNGSLYKHWNNGWMRKGERTVAKTFL